MDPDERAELTAALHQTPSFADALLEVNDKLVRGLSGEGDAPSEADLAYLREGLERWKGSWPGCGSGLVGC